MSNLAYSEAIQKRLGGSRTIDVLVARMAADGPGCTEIAIKTARALGTLFWQSTAAVKVGVAAHVPAVATRVLAAHVALPFVTTKLVSLLAICSSSAGAPEAMAAHGGLDALAAVRSQPWFVQTRSFPVAHGHRKQQIIIDTDRLGERPSRGGRRRGCAHGLTPPVPRPALRADAILFACAV